MLRIFIGYDAQQPIAYHVLAQSLQRHATGPLSITPIVKRHLTGLYQREPNALESTDFTLTRFLTPSLSNYEGVSVFMDCDMLCQSDPYELLLYALANPEQAVQVVKHEYTPKHNTKFLGHSQTTYPRKNWSSVMVFNNAQCRVLTPEYVSHATPLTLHRFQWLHDHEIGSLPKEWNWLVGEYPPNPDAKLLHYTLGTPCFEEYRTCDHADAWMTELTTLMHPLQKETVWPRS